jgi:hypothetical protein
VSPCKILLQAQIWGVRISVLYAIAIVLLVLIILLNLIHFYFLYTLLLVGLIRFHTFTSIAYPNSPTYLELKGFVAVAG